MYDDLYKRTPAFSRDFRRGRYIAAASAAVRVSFRGNLEDDGLIHRNLFVGNYVKATLPYLGKSTVAR